MQISLRGIEVGDDRALGYIERMFFYMPLVHAENVQIQRKSVAMYKKLLSEAPPQERDVFATALQSVIRHAEIIERFGRYPHRNAILGRPSTAEEIEFLKQPGSSF